MSKHFVVDGYNLLYALPQMPAGSWEAKRAALLDRLGKERPQGRNAITVVFDSREGLGDRGAHGDIRVLYPAAQTADDWIIAFVRETPNPREVVVVTDDQGIRRMIRGTGAQSLGCAEFLQKARPPAGPKAGPAVDRDEITDELRKRWLE